MEFDLRRAAPRVLASGLCSVVADRTTRTAVMLDVAPLGLRLEAPFDPKTARRIINLELELPGVDEIAWARGHVTFAQLVPLGGVHPDGQPRFLCRAGLVLELPVARDRRLLREYVMDTHALALRAVA